MTQIDDRVSDAQEPEDDARQPSRVHGEGVNERIKESLKERDKEWIDELAAAPSHQTPSDLEQQDRQKPEPGPDPQTDVSGAERPKDGDAVKPELENGDRSRVTMRDIEPFRVDPILDWVRRLRGGPRPWAILLILAGAVALLVTYVNALTKTLYRPVGADAWYVELWDFMLRSPSKSGIVDFGYARDVPSIVLTLTIVLAVYLVYDLFIVVSGFHTSMARNGCIKFLDERSSEEFADETRKLNDRMSVWGRRSRLMLPLIAGFVVLLNLRLEDGLFAFFIGGGVYSTWWASLQSHPAGGVIWVLIGVLGAYVIYVEALTGLSYVAFLRRTRNLYVFQPNVVNVDGFYGWRSLRHIVTNLEWGAVVTMVSAWAMSFFLEPVIGPVFTALVLCGFGGIVCYVFFGINLSFRAQVKNSLETSRRQLAAVIAEHTGPEMTERDFALLGACWLQLSALEKIPSSPIRRGTVIAGVLSVVGPLSAVVVQMFRYFA